MPQIINKCYALGTAPTQEHITVERLNNDKGSTVGLKVTVGFLDGSNAVINNEGDVANALAKIHRNNHDGLQHSLKRTSRSDQPFFRMSIQDAFIAHQRREGNNEDENNFHGGFFKSSTPPRVVSRGVIEAVIIDTAGLASGLYFGVPLLAIGFGTLLTFSAANLFTSSLQLSTTVESEIIQTVGLIAGCYVGFVPLALLCGILLLLNVARQIGSACESDIEPSLSGPAMQ